jgi:hypothetical protein
MSSLHIHRVLQTVEPVLLGLHVKGQSLKVSKDGSPGGLGGFLLNGDFVVFVDFFELVFDDLEFAEAEKVAGSIFVDFSVCSVVGEGGIVG